MNAYLDIHPEVKAALEANQPVVALESTIISHGMPYPDNVTTALKVEETIRENGAIPATIAIIGGRLKVGLTHEEIEYLGKTGLAITKTSRRDMPVIISKKMDGATTVATTMMIAAMAGVKVFATGGIGGVHRGAETTFDISADLQELANTDVAVVCAGCKSILDIGLTLEYLETNGVPVIGYQTKVMPAFYNRESDFGVDYQLDTAEEIAGAMKAKWEMNLKGGMVVANPIPEQFSMSRDLIDPAIEQALRELDEQGVKGKESTPFLLSRVKELTGGDSLESNIELVLNNARLGAAIAKSYCAA
ncbi:pseudouridine-5'-phosphate glycosidase [Parendozoicomonas haliclonae]|uniref:Pseudouridine-5'-phosphate glycosidase n=1 Tax=Parendozoicomonas haliclonae TaxID=1960125 RepID=A0A1X7AR25_9GAMM|nr:pseudouridine-5'-phosphate glycosidase [Parendozoicomonas haliclonae]SMA49857.1 Pseudouridine-5'-phosphate glycosidase [Parendozoicomonas haliclonae]